MTYRIVFKWGSQGPEDEFVIEGETLQDISEAAHTFFESRNLDIDECFLYSEEIK